MLARVNCKKWGNLQLASAAKMLIFLCKTKRKKKHFPVLLCASWKRKVITPIAEITSRQKFSIVPSIVM